MFYQLSHSMSNKVVHNHIITTTKSQSLRLERGRFLRVFLFHFTDYQAVKILRACKSGEKGIYFRHKTTYKIWYLMLSYVAFVLPKWQVGKT